MNVITDCIYSHSISAKDGSLVPTLNGSHSMFSIYNPSRDIGFFANDASNRIPNDEYGFFVIGGLGDANHIKKLRELRPQAFIIVLEVNKVSIDFLSNEFCLDYLENDNKLKVCTLDNLGDTILENYLPVIYGSFAFCPQRVWFDCIGTSISVIKQAIDLSLAKITADYSVQSHFGKLWFNNFFTNMAFFFSPQNTINKALLTRIENIQFPVDKTAVITAAGPSLDFAIEKLLINRESYYIIATDTSFPALISQNIQPDALLSIDAQAISASHFYCNIPSETLCVVDICANPSAIRKMTLASCKILLSSTNHPLTLLPDVFLETSNFFLELNAGNGTVTCSAVDFAQKCGFHNIICMGADFSYLNGKPYTKGTYLDNNFNIQSSRLISNETLFNTLMFRTELIPIKGKKRVFTSTVLQSYRESVENLLTNQCKHTKQVNKSHENIFNKLNFNDFLFSYHKALNEFTFSSENESIKNFIFLSILPLAAWGMKQGLLAKEKHLSCVIELAVCYLLRFIELSGVYNDEKEH